MERMRSLDPDKIASVKDHPSTRVKVILFDIFDTVLTRAVGSPESSFLLLGKYLYDLNIISSQPEIFSSLRIEAEKIAHEHTGAKCTIENIYDELAVLSGWDVKQRAFALDMEYRLEDLLIRTVPWGKVRIQQARDLGQRIIFVSDMYMPSAWLRRRLMTEGLMLEGDGCYVSCELGKTKETGGLFTEVLNLEGVTAAEAVHIGNSYDKDIRPAARLGLRTEYFPIAEMNRYEVILESFLERSGGLTSVMAGASRLTRLGDAKNDTKQAAIRNVAAGVAGPILSGYVLWVLNRAKQLGLECLYFVSRDGQVLLEIAKRLEPKLGIQCELRYLYGSRQAWNLPAIFTATPDELAWIWDKTDFLSIKMLLMRVGIEPELIETELKEMGFAKLDWNRQLRTTEIPIVKNLFQKDRLKSLVVEKARQKRQLLWAYLEQENVTKHAKWGMVDLGWYGSLQNSLSAVLVEKEVTLPVGFYFALLEGDLQTPQSLQKEAYYFNEHRKAGYLDSKFDIIVMMEMFCASNHGTVIDYELENGAIRPILKEKYNQRVIDWGLDEFRQSIIGYTNNLFLNPEWVNLDSDMRAASAQLFEAFWHQPSTDEADSWAGFPWEDGLGSETYFSPLAKSYHWRDFFKMIYARKVLYHHRSSWYPGSLLLTSPLLRSMIISLGHLFRFIRSTRYRIAKRLNIANIFV